MSNSNDPWVSESWWTRDRPLTKPLRIYFEEQYKDLSVVLFAKIGKFYEIYGPHVGMVEELLQKKPSVKCSKMHGVPNNGVPYTLFPATKRILGDRGMEVRVIYPVGNRPDLRSRV